VQGREATPHKASFQFHMCVRHSSTHPDGRKLTCLRAAFHVAKQISATLKTLSVATDTAWR